MAFAAVTQSRDRADNAFEFTYDADTADMVTATSSARFTRDDLVDFTVVVKDVNPTHLLGRVTMELASDKRVRYQGTLSFKVTDQTGDPVVTIARPVSFTLRPNGVRTKVEEFPFDVASGTYSVTASFSAR